MPRPVQVKICGLTQPDTLRAATEAGAAYVGFVFFAKSPRNVSISDAAHLAALVPAGVMKVGLMVDPSNQDLDAILARVPLDMIQLHGHEPPARVSDVRARTGLPVMKAVGIADAADLPQLDTYARVADQLLVDAKPPASGELPGGNGLSFDWRLIAGRRWPVPWMLAGGLTPDNVAEAVQMTGAPAVDVSSGVERAPGVKDAGRIADFLKASTEH
ncbi:MAG: phosphoribosylanthranilate isomerase [Pseudomonadota bacterium]